MGSTSLLRGLCVVWATLVVVDPAPVWSAAPARGARPPPSKSADPAPAPAPGPDMAAPPVPAAGGRVAHAGKSVDQLLAASAEACESLDFVRCLEMANAALERPEIKDPQRVQAYTQLGAAYAVVGDVTEAERPYRLLLRLRPDHDMGPETPPKIMAVFRKVQAEENQIRAAVRDAQRRNLVQSLEVRVEAPERHVGGRPLVVRAHVTDPQRGVESLVLEHRTSPGGPFSTAPFRVTPQGQEVTFTGAQTATDKPVRLEYVVVARDKEGEALVTVGTQAEPRAVEVAAGQVPGEPFYAHRAFWVAALGGGAALGAGLLVVAAVAVVGTAVGSAILYLFLRGDGVPPTSAGKHQVRF